MRPLKLQEPQFRCQHRVEQMLLVRVESPADRLMLMAGRLLFVQRSAVIETSAQTSTLKAQRGSLQAAAPCLLLLYSSGHFQYLRGPGLAPAAAAFGAQTPRSQLVCGARLASYSVFHHAQAAVMVRV